jgi:hypothetical protein
MLAFSDVGLNWQPTVGGLALHSASSNFKVSHDAISWVGKYGTESP